VRAARKRDAANPLWRFYGIVARTRGNADRVSMAEADDLWEMAEAAAQREDFHAAKRIQQFLDGDDQTPPRKGRGKGADELDELIEDEEIMGMLFSVVMQGMPRKMTAKLREMVDEIGHDQAVAQMAEMLRTSPGAPKMPEPMLRQLSEVMVARALESNQSGRGRTGHGRLL
jgi:hypothetical protein